MAKRNGPRSCGPCGCPSGGTPTKINYPGCTCQGSPFSISLAYTPAPGESPPTYPDSTIRWYAGGSDVPPYAAAASMPNGPGYFSDAPHYIGGSQYSYYQLRCVSTGWGLSFLSYLDGVPGTTLGGLVWEWVMGGRNPTSFCNPFLLAGGAKAQGTFVPGKFTASG